MTSLKRIELTAQLVELKDRTPDDGAVVCFGEPDIWMTYGTWDDKQKHFVLNEDAPKPLSFSVCTHWVEETKNSYHD